jgi:hypothetical protein
MFVDLWFCCLGPSYAPSCHALFTVLQGLVNSMAQDLCRASYGLQNVLLPLQRPTLDDPCYMMTGATTTTTTTMVIANVRMPTGGATATAIWVPSPGIHKAASATASSAAAGER